jgi:ubiquinone/menaquinone biosynthesis C-methylase UbiE
VDRNTAVTTEFSRQASVMARAPAFHSADVLERIARAIGSVPGRVLDLACGPGIVAEQIAPLADELTGVDVTPRMVELAAARCESAKLSNCSFHVASAEHLPFASSAFDTVVTRLALHHFQAPADALAEVWRVLRPDGRLVVADIVSSPVAEEAALHNALERLRDPTHVRMLSATELAPLMSASRFEVLHQESWQQLRVFTEWADVVAAPERTQPLEVVMRSLARAGYGAGIHMEDVAGELRFRHTWQLLIARRTR